MAARGSRKRVEQALHAADLATDPVAAIEAAQRLREAAEAFEVAKVAEARAAGTTWTRIGALYGTTKQGAQQRFGGASGTPRE